MTTHSRRAKISRRLEAIQFGRATPLGGGLFRLSHLLRGRGGTEWACDGHSGDDVFCLIKPGTLAPVVLPSWSIGTTVGAVSAGAASASIEFVAEGVRPPSPVNLVAEHQASGDLLLSWTRSRQGFAWLDGIDAPLGETIEQYRATLSGSSTSLELLAGEPSVTVSALSVATLGSGAATVEVRQIGDLAVSRPTTLNLILP
jgi:hypothetical protein